MPHCVIAIKPHHPLMSWRQPLIDTNPIIHNSLLCRTSYGAAVLVIAGNAEAVSSLRHAALAGLAGIRAAAALAAERSSAAVPPVAAGQPAALPEHTH